MRYLMVGALVYVLMAGATQALAALGQLTGKESGIWSDGHLIVVLGRVDDVARLPDDQRREGTHRVTLTPLSTLAGTYDCTTDNSKLVANVFVGAVNTRVQAPPPRDSFVVAVVYRNVSAGDPPQSRTWIASDICTFMPETSGIFVIDRLDDPRIMKIVENIRAARADPHPNSQGAATTQPATAPARPSTVEPR